MARGKFIRYCFSCRKRLLRYSIHTVYCKECSKVINKIRGALLVKKNSIKNKDWMKDYDYKTFIILSKKGERE